MFIRPFTPSPGQTLCAAAAVTLALSATGACARDAHAQAVDLDPIVVTATRTEKPLSQTASSLDVLTETDLEAQAYSTFSEALEALPNVSVTSPGNPLFTRISLRGSDENQITYVIDGVRQDNYTLSGNRPTGLFIDPELIKQIEVRRGGGSALYGNGGIGGALAVTTKRAADFLAQGEAFGSKLKTGYSSLNQEWMQSAYAFGRWRAWDTLLAVTHRRSGDEKRSDGRRVTANKVSQARQRPNA